MSTQSLTTLTYEVDGPVARITLNRPDRGNTITLDMADALSPRVERNQQLYGRRQAVKERDEPFGDRCIQAFKR